MGIKKIARPMNKAKNSFVKWMEKNNAEDIDVYEGAENDSWDYYRNVDAFINNVFYVATFMVWDGQEVINYSRGTSRYMSLSIDEFMELIK